MRRDLDATLIGDVQRGTAHIEAYYRLAGGHSLEHYRPAALAQTEVKKDVSLPHALPRFRSRGPSGKLNPVQAPKRLGQSAKTRQLGSITHDNQSCLGYRRRKSREGPNHEPEAFPVDQLSGR
jgi:hypothetical protein